MSAPPSAAQLLRLLADLSELKKTEAQKPFCWCDPAFRERFAPVLLQFEALDPEQLRQLAAQTADAARAQTGQTDVGQTCLTSSDYAALLKVYVYAMQSPGNGALNVMQFTGLTLADIVQLDALTEAFESGQQETPCP